VIILKKKLKKINNKERKLKEEYIIYKTAIL